MDKESIRVALTRVAYPGVGGGSGGDVVGSGALRKVSYCDGYASLTIAAGGLHEDQRRGLMQQASAAVRLHGQQSGVELHDVHVELTEERVAGGGGVGGSGAGSSEKKVERVPDGPAQERASALPGVRHAIAVGAGKGGVGKSTIAVNLAVGLARKGYSVGLMDGDIYGPSMPTLLGLAAEEVHVVENRIQPFFVHGVKCNTIGKLVDSEKPLIWRGPMAHGAFRQLVEQTAWGELDYLVIDLPPGTGDVPLTMAQLLRLTGAVVVCTPQKVAQDDAVRAARMFAQLGIEVLGVVENMSYFVAEDVEPARVYDLFGRGGAEQMAQRLGLPFLGSVPVTISLRENSDAGDPTANFAGGGELARRLEGLVSNLESQVALAAMRLGQRTPTLSIS